MPSPPVLAFAFQGCMCQLAVLAWDISFFLYEPVRGFGIQEGKLHPIHKEPTTVTRVQVFSQIDAGQMGGCKCGRYSSR